MVGVVHLLYTQGVKMYYLYQVTGTQPMKNKGKWASVEVTDLETGMEYTIITEHVVLNIASEVLSGCRGTSLT